MDLSKFHIAFNDFTVSNTVFHGGCGASVDVGMIFHERRLCEGQSHNSMFCVGGVLDDFTEFLILVSSSLTAT